MKVIWTLGWRNLWRHRKRTILTTLTIALGLALYLISLALNDGGHHQIVESVVRMGSGHVVIQAPGYFESGGVERFLEPTQWRPAFENLPAFGAGLGVRHVVPRVFASGLASSADGASGVLLIGSEPNREREASEFADRLVEGEFLDADDVPQAVVGHGVGRKLALGIGDRMVLTAQAARGGELESILVRVAGIVRTGVEEMDELLVMIPLTTAAEFLRMGDRVHQIAVVLDDAANSGRLASVARSQFPDLEILTWEQAHPEVVDYIRIDNAGNHIFSMVLFTLIGFLVLNTLLMSVLERTREFALLDALGVAPHQRFQMVMLEAVIVAAMASAAGLALGYGVHLYLAIHGLPLDLFVSGDLTVAGVAFDPVIYSELSTRRILQTVSLVFGLAMVLALVPARRAAKPGEIGILGRN